MTELRDSCADLVCACDELLRALGKVQDWNTTCVGDCMDLVEAAANCARAALAKDYAQHDPTRRWNIERDGDDLLICEGNHERSQACEFTRYSPAALAAGGGAVVSQPMFYVAEDPNQPGAAFGSCVDDPRFAKSTAKDVADWIRRGGIIRRVDGETMQKMLKAWRRPGQEVDHG